MKTYTVFVVGAANTWELSQVKKVEQVMAFVQNVKKPLHPIFVTHSRH
jgi:hypothetical protein